MRTSPILAPHLAGLLLVVFAGAALPMDRSGSPSGPLFFDVPRQSAEFIGYARTIALNPARQKLRDRVLERISAACGRPFARDGCGGMNENDLIGARSAETPIDLRNDSSRDRRKP